jgi:cathepsin L
MFEEYQYCYTSYYGADSACLATSLSSSPVATVDGYVALATNNYSDLMNAIATIGPIAVSVDASSWHAYKGGIFAGCNQASPDINHVVVLVGYGEERGQKYWLVRNSWSAAWGEKGYIKLARTDSDDENCGIDVTPQNGSACEGQTEPVKACGTCGVLYDSSYPTGARAL